MNVPKSAVPALHSVLAAVFILLCASCAHRPPAQGGDSADRDGYTIAGYRFNAKDETRQKVVARFGPPLAEENAGSQGQYRVLSYPVAGEPEKLLLLFHGEEMLGAFREGMRDSISNTVRSHERHAGGRVVLYSSWFEGKTTRFVATQAQLEKLPKWSPKDGGVAPLTEAQAETIVLEWCQRKAPDLSVQPKVRQTVESPSVPGLSFYIVNMGLFNAPQLFRQVVVLMDGTVVAGETESNE